MSLSRGSRIGAYEILDLLGAGGMGEVYRARDTKLKRDVAVKILPEAFVSDADRLARFQREAEVLATLNHPNIAAVYGLEDSGGIVGIVLELVEGGTLSERIAAGAVPLDEALAIARQIADALEAAHDKGIIHRDLKPANIKVTADGTVKLLDFGLAKMLEPDGSSQSGGPGGGALSMSPTLSVHATMQGVILGTAAYMSPEQARGKPVDRRTDIWAFGCVLFEMLAGRQPFESGETVSDAVAAILKNDPDWDALPVDTPPHIRSLLRRCLQKDPRRRLPHIGVARIEIDEGASPDAAPSLPAATVAPASRARTLAPWLAAAVGVTAAAVLAVVVLRHREPIDLGAVRFLIAVPPGATLGSNTTLRGTGLPPPHFAPSPDGRRLAFVMYAGNNKAQLWIRGLGELETRPLPGTDDASFPFWSPDSRFVAFFAQGKLKRVDVSGGPVLTVCDAPAGEGGTWNRDGDIVFARDASSGLFRVSATGGSATLATTLAAGEASHRWPQFLPDGRHFLYLAMVGKAGGLNIEIVGSLEQSRVVYVGSLDSSERTAVLRGTLRSEYASGHLLFIREDTLMAQVFDAASLHLSGEATPLVEGVASNLSNGRTAFAMSESGVLVYRAGSGAAGARLNRLEWVDRSGKFIEQVGAPGDYRIIRLSPDGKRLAAYIGQRASPAGDIWLIDLDRDAIATSLTLTPAEAEIGMAWSPDGSHLAYVAGENGSGLYQKSTTGGGDADLLLKSAPMKRVMSWSPDGRYIAFQQGSEKTRLDILLFDMVGRTSQYFVQTVYDDRGAIISPDGHLVAFNSDKSGTYAVYVRPFPSGDREWRVSVGDGSDPQWRADSKELFYLSQRTMMGVAVKPGPVPEFSSPVKLFESPIVPGSIGEYAVVRGGERFLLIDELGPATGSDGLNVMLDWPSALRK